MSRYDGLIIPRSYSEYINKTDAATLLQALQQSGVMDAAPTANSNHPIKSSGVYDVIKNQNISSQVTVTEQQYQCDAYRTGKVVQVQLILNNSEVASVIPKNKTLVTGLPRLNETIYISGVGQSRNTVYQVNANGSIISNQEIPSGEYSRLCFSYVTID